MAYGVTAQLHQQGMHDFASSLAAPANSIARSFAQSSFLRMAVAQHGVKGVRHGTIFTAVKLRHCEDGQDSGAWRAHDGATTPWNLARELYVETMRCPCRYGGHFLEFAGSRALGFAQQMLVT